MKRLSDIVFGPIFERLSSEMRAERQALESRFSGELAEIRRSLGEMERRVATAMEARVSAGDAAVIQTIYDTTKRPRRSRGPTPIR